MQENTVISPKSHTDSRLSLIKRENNSPLALIIEPSKELAEQTYQQIQLFKKHLTDPPIKELLIVGGIPMKEQLRVLENGVDICVATPGRLDDLIMSNQLSLNQVRFFILDEVDGLLTQGHRELIMKIYNRIPKVSADARRLHSVPDTIHHCVCLMDPIDDGSWRTMKKHIATDGVHATDRLNYHSESKGLLTFYLKCLKF